MGRGRLRGRAVRRLPLRGASGVGRLGAAAEAGGDTASRRWDSGTSWAGAFSTMGRYWKQLFGMAAALYGGATLLMGAAVAVAYSAVSDHLDRVVALDQPRRRRPRTSSLVTAGIVLGLLGIVTISVVSGLMYAAVPAVLQEAVLGRPVAFSTVWRRAWARVFP